MPAYITRWPDGEVSIVVADSKDEAIAQLDQIDSPDPTQQVHRLTNCSLHFKPINHGQEYLLALAFEETADEIYTFFYPNLRLVKNTQ